MNLRERLRHETQMLHEQVEAECNVLRPGFHRHDYIHLLGKLHGWLAAVEPVLATALPPPFQAAFTSRHRADALMADMRYFGVEASSLEIMPWNATNIDELTALGAMYVVDGSALGGQVILKHLSPTLDISPTAGGRYFSGDGQDVRAQFKTFCAQLDAFDDPQSADRIMSGAKETFARLLVWMQQRD